MCLGWRGNKWSARDNPPFAAPPCSLKCVASLPSPKLLQTHSHVRYFYLIKTIISCIRRHRHHQHHRRRNGFCTYPEKVGSKWPKMAEKNSPEDGTCASMRKSHLERSNKKSVENRPPKSGHFEAIYIFQ